MSILKLIFIYGVVITIFNVIWFFIEWLLKLLLTDSSNNSITWIKVVSISILSVLLAHESNLFTQNVESNENYQWILKSIGALVLYLYVVGKSEEKPLRVFSNLSQTTISKASFYPNWLPYLGVGLYIAGLFLTNISNNKLTNWFHEHIFDIYNTFFLKLIFGVIAFFFMLNIIGKAFSSFFNFGPKQNPDKGFNNKRNDDDFDDYEIVEDDKLNK